MKVCLSPLAVGDWVLVVWNCIIGLFWGTNFGPSLLRIFVITNRELK